MRQTNILQHAPRVLFQPTLRSSVPREAPLPMAPASGCTTSCVAIVGGREVSHGERKRTCAQVFGGGTQF